MGQAKIKANKLANKVSNTIVKNGVRLVNLFKQDFTATEAELTEYRQLTGRLPYEFEHWDAQCLIWHDRVMKQIFGTDCPDFPEMDSWRDIIAVFDCAYTNQTRYLPLRVPFNDITVTRPAYGDEITLTGLEYALCVAAIGGSTVNQIIAERYLRNKDASPVRVGAFSFVSAEQGQQRYDDAREVADRLGFSNVFSVLD